MYILGIDPGSRNCGYGIIAIENLRPTLVDAGIIKIQTRNLQSQIVEFIEGIDIIFKSYTINQVAMEDIFYAYNPKTVIKLAQFRGAISLKILQDIGNFAEYTPLQVKKSLTGNGKADKKQVAYMVKTLLKITVDIQPLDVSDALAVALTHAQNMRYNALSKR
ncbi:crossover junction endodeoxyribonuclease RuvC [Helicobacter aurati]|uniref:Crossover junction endodeoxyribonuclease RuvC n=1 Tax=Helicobacter aurati TaxID=137778 RepID=A0A3D8J3F9_9HELI|nr:crossover junction endodeoxyribonuclease RuvC [Helicobacter aurati]RDU71953.1 crossover junction endodeoxyribonuclease RuvC [Helicobacter aurati]